ncbi:MAG: hypothetical protein IPN46_20960 [Saprospiraceae bacterium]|nr:hypothetical protein [Saprospiraceae bacterium]
MSNQSTDSPAVDAIQFNLNVSATSGSLLGLLDDVSGGTTVTLSRRHLWEYLQLLSGNGTAGVVKVTSNINRQVRLVMSTECRGWTT